MTESELLKLIAHGESMTLEFKRDAPISANDLLEAVVCLANADGGTLLVGVEDNGQITGVHQKHLEMTSPRLEASINNRTRPSAGVRATRVAVGNVFVDVIDVPQAKRVISTTDGKTMRRSLDVHNRPECIPFYPDQMPSRLSQLTQYDHSAEILSNTTWDELDPLEFERLNQLLQDNPNSDPSLRDLGHLEQAKALGLVKTVDGVVRPTLAGLLLVGRQRALQEFVPSHEAAFQVLGAEQAVEVNQFFREPLLKLLQSLEQYILVRNREQELDWGLQRIGIPLYPKEAVRESLANALVHRDYSLRQAVYVRILENDALSISSPGGFVEGVTLENIISTEPRPRNPMLADIFKRLGLVERTARGVERIFESILRTGRAAPSYFGTNRQTVKLSFSGGEADLKLVYIWLEVQNRLGKPLDWATLLILHQVALEGDINTNQATQLLENNVTHATMLLNRLLELGLLEARGFKRPKTYHLSAAVYEQLGKPEAYVRQRGLVATEQEIMVSSLLKAKSEITRADVMRLFTTLSEDQASYLLRRLVKQGKLEMVGIRNKAIYRTVQK